MHISNRCLLVTSDCFITSGEKRERETSQERNDRSRRLHEKERDKRVFLCIVLLCDIRLSTRECVGHPWVAWILCKNLLDRIKERRTEEYHVDLFNAFVELTKFSLGLADGVNDV